MVIDKVNKAKTTKKVVKAAEKGAGKSSSAGRRTMSKPSKQVEMETNSDAEDSVSNTQSANNDTCFDGNKTLFAGDLRKELEKAAGTSAGGAICEECKETVRKLTVAAINDHERAFQIIEDKHQAEKTQLLAEIDELKRELKRTREAERVQPAPAVDRERTEEMAKLKDTHEAEKQELLGTIENLKVKAKSVEDAGAKADAAVEKEWEAGKVASIIACGRIDGLNGVHSTERTDKLLTYRVNGVLIGVCLHCFEARRLPSECLFLRGKSSVNLHRNSSKCVKPGIPSRTEPAKIDKRMLEGKDWLSLRFPNFNGDWLLKAKNNTRPPIVDDKSGKERNRTVQEIVAYKTKYRELHGIPDNEPVPGPKWYLYQLVSNFHNATIQSTDSFYDYITTCWVDYRVENDIVFDMAQWRAEKADFRSADDKIRENKLENDRSGRIIWEDVDD